MVDGGTNGWVGDMPLCGDVPCEEDDAGGLLVDAMTDADARIGRPGPRKLKLSGELFERTGGFPASGDDGEAGGFVDGGEVVVFPEEHGCGG